MEAGLPESEKGPVRGALLPTPNPPTLPHPQPAQVAGMMLLEALCAEPRQEVFGLPKMQNVLERNTEHSKKEVERTCLTSLLIRC